jgi:hypothetical protein
MAMHQLLRDAPASSCSIRPVAQADWKSIHAWIAAMVIWINRRAGFPLAACVVPRMAVRTVDSPRLMPTCRDCSIGIESGASRRVQIDVGWHALAGRG